MSELADLISTGRPALLAPLAIFVVLGALLAIRYSRPYIGCRRLPVIDGEHRFHLRNFMSIDVPGALSILITSDKPVGYVRVSAGPWFRSLRRLEEMPMPTFVLTLDGAPADGLIGIAIQSVDRADIELTVAAESEVRPRGFRPEGMYTFESESLAVARWGLGVLVAIALYGARFALFSRFLTTPLLSHQAKVWDAFSFAAILVVSIVAYRFCIRPFKQDSVEGSIDWSSPSGEWPSP